MIPDKDNKYNFLTDFSSDVKWIFNLTKNEFVFVSPSVIQLRGLTVSDALSERLEDAFAPESFKIINNDFKLLLDNENKTELSNFNSFIVEVQQPCKDGSLVWVEMSCNIRIGDNKDIEVFGVSRNIQKRKTFELALRASEEKYRQIIENSHDIIYKMHVDGEFIFVSPAWKVHIGHDETGLVGQPFQKFIHPDDIPGFEIFFKNIIKQGVRQSGFEFRIKDIHGQWKWHATSANPIKDSEGKVIAFDGISTDITLRKKSETQLLKLSQVVEQSPNMILISDLEATIEYVNPAYCSISGFCVNELLGTKYKVLQTVESDEKEFESLWECLREGKIWKGEIIDARKNGETYWQGVSINPIMNESGVVTHYVSIIQDISDRKKVEEELLELTINLEQKVEDRTAELALTNEFLMNEIISRKNKEEELEKSKEIAEKANKAKSEFISRMSHELRTPLNSILGFAQLFEMGELSPGHRKGVHHMLNSGKHLLKLINEVLDISKIEAGKFSLNNEIIDLNRTIAEAVDLVTPATFEHNISIVYDKHLLGNIQIEADKQRLIQVLVNLLNNAVKYNKPNGIVNISVQIHEMETYSRQLSIAVTDTGFGILTEDIPKLFIPFERINQDDSVTEGTGLGLSIAKQIITAMEGDIEVESKHGVGSVFRIFLPYNIKNQSNKFQYKMKSELPEEIRLISKGTILHIEREIANLEFVEDLIVSYRPEIKIVSDNFGKNTLALAIKHMPNVILLDSNLPDIHYFKVIKSLKENKSTSNIPVILLIEERLTDKDKNILEKYSVEFITIPLQIPEFLNVIDKFRTEVH